MNSTVTPNAVTLTAREAMSLAASLATRAAGDDMDATAAALATFSASELRTYAVATTRLAGAMLRAEHDELDGEVNRLPAAGIANLFARATLAPEAPEDQRPAPEPPPIAVVVAARAHPRYSAAVLVDVLCPYCQWTEEQTVPDDDGTSLRESHCIGGPYLVAGCRPAQSDDVDMA